MIDSGEKFGHGNLGRPKQMDTTRMTGVVTEAGTFVWFIKAGGMEYTAHRSHTNGVTLTIGASVSFVPQKCEGRNDRWRALDVQVLP